jgi:hypothetical protein
VEIEERFVSIDLGPTLDEATSCALNDMMDLIHRKTGRSLSEVIMVISAVGDRFSSYTFLPNLCRCPESDMARIQAGATENRLLYSVTPYPVYRWTSPIGRLDEV